MANKQKSTGGKPCKCETCGTEANSIPGTQHRRCSGQPDQLIRPKHDKLSSTVRGRWA